MLAIVGGKGGCGKTTTALGLARALARDGPRPLVVDADCAMPNLHTMAETDRRPGLGAVANGVAPDRLRHRSHAYPAVDVLPAGTATGSPDERVLRRVGSVPGPVLLDCPGGATESVATPVRAADAALVVSTAERASLQDAVKTARMARELGTDPCGAVITRTRGSVPDVPEATDLRAECPVLGTVPETEDVLASRTGRTAYGNLADRFPERNT